MRLLKDITQVVDWIETTMNQFGYPGLSLLMFLETLVPPIPSEIVMPLAGFAAAEGRMTWSGVVIAGLVGSTIGMLPLYYIGRAVGEDRLKEWIDKYGKPFTLKTEDIDHAKEWLERHGDKAVVFSHLLPGVRSLISIPAGIIEMNLIKFLLLTILGKGIWTGILAYAGILLRENYQLVSQYLQPISFIVMGGSILYIVYKVVSRKRQQVQ